MTTRSFGYQEFGLGLAVGLTTGAVMGILFAPQSGPETRERIRSRASDLRASVEELLETAKKNLDLAAAKVEGALGRQEKGLRRKLEKIRSELEKHDLQKARAQVAFIALHGRLGEGRPVQGIWQIL